MTDDALSVHGGAGGLTARYDDMLSWAGELESISGEVWDHTSLLARIAASPDLAASAVLSPFTAGVVEGHVTSAGAAVVSTSGRLRASALFARTAVEAYRATDEVLAVSARALRAVGTVAVVAADVTYLVQDAGALAVMAIADDDVELSDVPGMVQTHATQLVMSEVYTMPWMVDGAVDDAVIGLGGAWSFLAVVDNDRARSLAQFVRDETGGEFPPGSHEAATRDLVAIARAYGLFGDGVGSATEVAPWNGKFESKDLEPTSIKNILLGVNSKYDTDGQIRVISEIGQDGKKRWIVEIPGTEDWGMTAGANPMDLSSNVAVMAGLHTAQIDAVTDAMDKAGIQPGEDVLLAGHSQGGIVAAAIVSDPAQRAKYTITDVVTAGSPISGFDIPDHVNVLSLEHTTDAVPRLDSSQNPDRTNWVTVTRDGAGEATGEAGGTVHDTASAHSTFAYARTGGLIDVSQDPGLQRVKESLSKFTDVDPSSLRFKDYVVERMQASVD